MSNNYNDLLDDLRSYKQEFFISIYVEDYAMANYFYNKYLILGLSLYNIENFDRDEFDEKRMKMFCLLHTDKI